MRSGSGSGSASADRVPPSAPLAIRPRMPPWAPHAPSAAVAPPPARRRAGGGRGTGRGCRGSTIGWPLDGLLLLRGAAIGLVVTSIVASRLDPPELQDPQAWPGGALFHDVLYGSALAACSLLALVGAHRRLTDRRAWLLLAAAQTSWALGELAWAVDVRRGDASPSATLADLGWALSYLLAIVGLLGLIRRHVDRLRPSPLLDALTSGLAVAAVGAAWQLGRIAEGNEAGGLALAFNLAYPAADLLLVCLVVSSLALTAWRLDRGWLWLALGYGVAGVTDTAYALAVADGRYREGTPLDSGWLIASLAIAFACLPPADGRRPSRASPGGAAGGHADVVHRHGPQRADPGRARGWARRRAGWPLRRRGPGGGARRHRVGRRRAGGRGAAAQRDVPPAAHAGRRSTTGPHGRADRAREPPAAAGTPRPGPRGPGQRRPAWPCCWAISTTSRWSTTRWAIPPATGCWSSCPAGCCPGCARESC